MYGLYFQNKPNIASTVVNNMAPYVSDDILNTEYAGTSLEPQIPKSDNFEDWTISRDIKLIALNDHQGVSRVENGMVYSLDKYCESRGVKCMLLPIVYYLILLHG